MTALDRLIPEPRLVEINRLDLAAPAERVWDRLRHGALGESRVTRTLFAVRTLGSRRDPAARPQGGVRLDEMRSSPESPGFQILVDDPPREVAVGAIGQVWRLNIPFIHVPDAAAFAAFATANFVKVAWAIRVAPLDGATSHVELEVRVTATTERAWRRFRRYFRLIGPGSRYIRRTLLRALAREMGEPPDFANRRALPGDELLPDAADQVTQFVDIAAAPATIWPWLVQMGCQRAGFYSLDVLDNGGRRSAREIHPDLQTLAVGDIIPATPNGPDGFEVLHIDEPRALVLGGLQDVQGKRQVRFNDARRPRFWQVTWAFVLEPLDGRSTRLSVRARAAFSSSERRHAAWIGQAHRVMQAAQLRNIARRAEARLRRDDWRDVVRGAAGAARMVAAFVTPFRRARRRRWGLDEASELRSLPGDNLIAAPRWTWTHGVEIGAPASAVWPWVAQIGADRGGFYSYQWLENLAGCALRNAETVHPEWQVRAGQGLVVHPDMPPLQVVALEAGRSFVAYAPAAADAQAAGRPWVAVSWLFLVEPLGPNRCRFISRYRASTSSDFATRLAYGPALLEPIGFAMDSRMLLGVKRRAERRPAVLASIAAGPRVVSDAGAPPAEERSQ
jgi:hypothetical protein